MNYSPEVKAAALAAVLGGEAVASVSRRTGIGRATLIRWRNETGVDRTAIAQQKKEAIGEQLYGLLEDSIAYLRYEVNATRDEKWIKRQDADKLAIYHGVVFDKSVRLAAALRPPERDERDER
jgi:transposase-like protein